MRAKSLILLALIATQVCYASLLSYDLINLFEKEHELDCEGTDFIQLDSEYDAYSQILELLQNGGLDAQLSKLQALSDHTSKIIQTIGSPKQIASDPSYDKVLSGLKEELNAMMTEYQGTFIVGQCQQVSQQIDRCFDSPPDQKKSQVAMLKGLIEYLIQQISSLKDQSLQRGVTQQQVQASQDASANRASACGSPMSKAQQYQASQGKQTRNPPGQHEQQRIQAKQGQPKGQQIYAKPRPAQPQQAGANSKAQPQSQPQTQQQKPQPAPQQQQQQQPAPKVGGAQPQAPQAPKPLQQQPQRPPQKNEQYHQTRHRPLNEADACDVLYPPVNEVGEQVVCQDDRPKRRPKCVAGSDVTLSSSYKANEPTVQTEVKQINDVTEYGFGFWMRFLQLFPGFMKDGLLDKSYFVAKITKNIKDGDTLPGDRILTLFQTQDSYVFGAQHDRPERKESTLPIEYGDIEGVWTYVYYSYSTSERQAIGFYKQSNAQTRQVRIVAQQDPPNYLKFVLGGNYANYPGFNGQFSRPVLKIGLGTFLLDPQEFDLFAISCNQQPIVSNLQLKPYTFVKDQIYIDYDDELPQPKVDTIEVPLPEEYAVAGWFKWDQIEDQQQNWHSMFRLANTQKRKSQIIMGERVLSAWLGKPKGGQIHFSTYSYANMRGAGNPNAHQFIQHNNMHEHWHFVYFGYSRTLRRAYAQVQFKNGIKSVSFINVNHYLAPRHYFYFAREKQFPIYSGWIAYLEVFMCKGSFQQPVKPSYRPTPTPLPPRKKCVEGPARIINASYSKGPVVQVELHKEDLKDTTQYGFGFWFRYLSIHPTPFIKKRQDWSLLAKLTNKRESKDFRDGLLVIYQGQIGYFYISQDVKSKKQLETAQPFKDIEGVWTYTYFSYTKNQAAAFLMHEGQQPSVLEIRSKHPRFEYLYFQVGGKDPRNQYAGFNGQFSRPVLRLGLGTFFWTKEELGLFCLACNLPPLPDCQAKGGLKAVSKKTNKFSGKPINTTDKFGITDQYGVQGWFKWNGKKEAGEQLLFRLTTSEGPANALNANTLSVYFNPADQTIVFLTYSYSDTHGNGNPKVSQIMEGKAFVSDWFHIYFAYSRCIRQADVIVEHSQGKGQLTFKNINHYLAPTMLLYYGKDDSTKAFNGWIYGMNLLVCDITYQPTPKPPEDCAPVKEPICLSGEQYENVNAKNVDAVIQDLQKKKGLLQNKQFTIEKTQCYCFMSKFKDRRPRFVELADNQEQLAEEQLLEDDDDMLDNENDSENENVE